MKRDQWGFILTILGILAFSQTASASYFQRYCSNGEGTIRFAQGHDQDLLTVTKSQGSDDIEIRVEVNLDWSDIIAIEDSIQELESIKVDNCSDENETGTVSWYTSTVSHVTLSKTNGEVFEDDVIGVNQNGSVESYVICEERGSSEVICPL